MAKVMIHFEDQRGKASAPRVLEDDGDPPTEVGLVIAFSGRQFAVVARLEDKHGQAQYLARRV